MEKLITIKIKTLFAGKAWVHQKYLNAAKRNESGIVLEYKGETMTVPPERVKPECWTKGDRPFQDRFSGAPYYLYGIHFVGDDVTSGNLFKNN